MQIRVKHFCERSLAYFTPPKQKLVKTREQELFPSPGARYFGSASRDAILTVRCSGVVSAGPAARLPVVGVRQLCAGSVWATLRGETPKRPISPPPANTDSINCVLMRSMVESLDSPPQIRCARPKDVLLS